MVKARNPCVKYILVCYENHDYFDSYFLIDTRYYNLKKILKINK